MTSIVSGAVRADGEVRRLRGTDAGLLLGVAAVATLAFLLVHRALVDDAYITMTYARNLAFDLHWGLVPDETSNSATSPLNVLLLAAITAVVRDAQVAVGVLLVASAVLAARWLAVLSREAGLSRATPALAVGALLVNPLLLSTVGLEPFLCAALVAGLLRYGAAGRAGAFGVVGGLTVLARPDLAVVVLVALAGFAGVRRRWVRALGAVVAVALPWHVLSWFALGSALPDTLILKAGSSTWAGFGFWNGPLLYWGANRTVALVAFLPVLLGAVAAVATLAARAVRPRSRPVEPWQVVGTVAAAGAAAHYLAYCLLQTAPYHWYYAPLLIGATLCAAVLAGRLLVLGTGPAAGVALVGTGLVVASLVVDTVVVGTPWARAPISTNWASAAEYERIGTDLRTLVGAGTVESPGEIGTLAYYCGCRIVDPFSDRGRVLAAITAREERSGPLGRTLIGWNYRLLDRAETPRPVDARLVYESGRLPERPGQWPVDHWAEAPARMTLLPAAG